MARDRGGGEGRVENTVYIIVFCSPLPSARLPPPFSQRLLRRLLFLIGTISLRPSAPILFFLPQGSYISIPHIGLKPSVMIITSGIVTSELGEPALRLQEMATDNAVTAIFIL